MEGDIRKAYKVIEHLWNLGYAAEDIIKNIFKVCKNMDMEEGLKLDFIKVMINFNGFYMYLIFLNFR